MDTAIAVQNQDTGQNLIKLTVQEELMMKIAEMKNNNLTQSQLDEASKYCRFFAYQCMDVYGLSAKQLMQFTDEQLIELGQILFEKDSKNVIKHNILFVCILGVGWIARFVTWIDGGTNTENRVDLYKKLKIPGNKNFFPIKQLREYLKP